MISPSPWRWMLPVAVLAALGTAGGCQPEDPDPFSRNTGAGGSDDDDSSPPAPNSSAGYFEFQRSTNWPGSETEVLAIASWFSDSVSQVRIPIETGQDDCVTGVGDPASFRIPPTQSDAGETHLKLQDGTDLILEPAVDGESLVATSEPQMWEGNQEYTLLVTGGVDHIATEWSDAVGTPAALQFEHVEATAEGLDLGWLGGNNNGDVELRILPTDPENPASVIWVVCRLFDDGGHLVPPSALESLEGPAVEIELLRATTAEFEMDGGSRGISAGTSIDRASVDLPEFGDDDDSAGDDDDSADPGGSP